MQAYPLKIIFPVALTLWSSVSIQNSTFHMGLKCIYLCSTKLFSNQNVGTDLHVIKTPFHDRKVSSIYFLYLTIYIYIYWADFSVKVWCFNDMHISAKILIRKKVSCCKKPTDFEISDDIPLIWGLNIKILLIITPRNKARINLDGRESNLFSIYKVMKLHSSVLTLIYLIFTIIKLLKFYCWECYICKWECCHLWIKRIKKIE